jgi:hypothetical protein
VRAAASRLAPPPRREETMEEQDRKIVDGIRVVVDDIER